MNREKIRNALEEFRMSALAQNKPHLRCSVIATTLVTAWCLFSYHFIIQTDKFIILFIMLDLILVTILTALCGKTPGVIAVWVTFNVQTFLSREDFAYEQIIMLAASLITNLPARLRWYKSVIKTVVATACEAAVVTLASFIALAIFEGKYGIFIGSEPSAMLQSFIGIIRKTCISCTVASLLLWAYHRWMPGRIKKLFPESVFASPKIRTYKKHFSGDAKRHIGTKIFYIIFTQALLLLIVPMGVAGALMNDFTVRPSQLEGALFMTKLVHILALESIPGIFVMLDFARSNIANPIMFMSRAIDDFYSKTLQKKEGALFDMHKLGIANKDEIGVLFNSLKKTVDNVTEYVDAIEKKKQLESELAAANAANEAQRTFLSSMSHEIRTPINAVLGLDEMILRESSEPQIKGYARDIQSSGKSLLSIINDILDFSKIEAGKMEIINADYDLRSVITDLANMIETRAKNKGLDFIVDVDTAMPHLLYGDETRIKQCVLNILTNAVKYTPSGTVTLTAGCTKTDGEHIALRFSVKDTGIGIKAEDLPKLAKPFERIEEKRNRNIEGTGLGMSIVHGLLKGMGSALEVQSVYGEGSDFAFSVEQTVRSWEAIGTREEARAALNADTGSYTESFQAPDAEILVVDDTPMNLTVMRGLLKATRVKIDTAESAAEALDMARSKRYDLLFIDHLMPKMDGIEMLSALRADGTSKNQQSVCVALTANAISGAREQYLAAGFEDYLSKPVDGKKLEAMIAKYLPVVLLLRKGDKGYIEHASSAPASAADSAAGHEAAALFGSVFALSLEEALKNCGSRDVFMDAARAFYDAIDAKAADIARFAADGDWQDYTVQVHALKSSARLIGAAELSADAAALEQLGDKAKQAVAASGEADGVAGTSASSTMGGDNAVAAEIRGRTPALLTAYRAYKARLAPLFGLSAPEAADADGAGAEQKPVSEAELTDMLSALREVVSAFDFDTADGIIAELSARALPEAFVPTFTALKTAVRNADQAAVLSALGA